MKRQLWVIEVRERDPRSDGSWSGRWFPMPEAYFTRDYARDNCREYNSYGNHNDWGYRIRKYVPESE